MQQSFLYCVVIQLPCDRLCCVLRYVGQSQWFLTDKRGKFDWKFLDHKDIPLEEVNMSYTIINYRGLGNLGNELQLIFLKFHILSDFLSKSLFFICNHLFSFTVLLTCSVNSCQ